MMNPVIVPLKTEKRFLVTEELSLRFKLRCVEGDSVPEEHAALGSSLSRQRLAVSAKRQIDENPTRSPS
jgi:hypothetical protein